jgi:phospholipid/cholesterol/gamma-HCH transport system ATP-binding protein
MINVQNLSKRFNEQVVLKDIDLEIPEGQLLVILGESGSGKSVFLQHLIGLLKPDQGTIQIDEVDITQLSEKDLLKLRRNIGYLFQEGALYDFMTVFENVAFPLVEHSSLKPQQIEKKVNKVLELVGLEEAGAKYPSQLSGGMRKRAALARAIVLDSRFLFCDEPTSGLDPIKSREISDLIQNISRHLKCTTVVTSHDIHNSFRIADRVALIRDGEIIAVGKPQELKTSHDSFVKEFLT